MIEEFCKKHAAELYKNLLHEAIYEIDRAVKNKGFEGTDFEFNAHDQLLFELIRTELIKASKELER